MSKVIKIKTSHTHKLNAKSFLKNVVLLKNIKKLERIVMKYLAITGPVAFFSFYEK